MKLMDTLNRLGRFAIRYIPIALGIFVGILTNYRFQNIVDGILGVVTILFIYLLFLPEKIYIFKRPAMYYADKSDIKYSITDFLLAIISYWSIQRAVDAVLGMLALWNLI